MADKDERRLNRGAVEERPESVGDAPGRPWRRARITPAESGPVVATDACEGSDLTLDVRPAHGRTAEGCFEDNGRCPCPRSVKVHPAAFDVDEPTRSSKGRHVSQYEVRLRAS